MTEQPKKENTVTLIEAVYLSVTISLLVMLLFTIGSSQDKATINENQVDITKTLKAFWNTIELLAKGLIETADKQLDRTSIEAVFKKTGVAKQFPQ